MHYKEKRKVRELLSIIATVFDTDFSEEYIIDHVLGSLTLVKEILEQEAAVPAKTLDKITELHNLLSNPTKDPEYKTYLGTTCEEIVSSFDEEVEERLKVVFFPYKASMWDSLESIYFAAKRDATCDVEVVPVPYYKLSDNGAEPVYEGDLFPSDIYITHYSSYDLEVERPDIIFVHNIYDQYNTLTRVYEEYYTSNLKKYTDMLVYVPYCLFSFVPGSPAEYIAYQLPGLANVDRVILLAEYLKEAALESGVPKDKLLVLGSPKLDKMATSIERGVAYPMEWQKKIEGKKVFLLDTHLLFLATNKPFEQLETLIKLLSIPNIVENSVLIWRPHPLIKTAISKYNPYLLDYFIDLVENRIGTGEYTNVLFDDNADYVPALMAADVYIGGFSSLMFAYLLTGKKVVLLADRHPQESLVSGDAFHFLYDDTGSRIDLLRSLSLDVIAPQSQRQSVLEGVYANIDGSSGQKIYDTIKSQVFLFGGDEG